MVARALLLIALHASWSACSDRTDERSVPPSPPVVTNEVDNAEAYTLMELGEAGFQSHPKSHRQARKKFGLDATVPTSRAYDFLCRGEDRAERCICRSELPCTEADPCIDFERNLEVFREALGAAGGGVHCERAETGHCGSFHYFYFRGGIYRDEMRWFDASGALVAQRNLTDYNAYCNGTAAARWMGYVPRCAKVERDELICGEASVELPTPLGDLRDHTRDPFADMIPADLQ